MKKFSEFVIKNSKLVVFVTLVLTLIFGFFLKDLKINPDIISALPQNDPDVKLFNYIGDEYGGNSLALIAIETDEIFNKNTIKNIADLTDKIKFLDGVSYVTSLTNVLDIKKGIDGIEIGRLIDEYDLPKAEKKLEELKSYVLSKDMYRDKLVSYDSKTTLIICRIDEDFNKIEVAKNLKKLISDIDLKGNHYFGGMPFQMIEMSKIVLNDLKFLIPLILTLIFLSLYLSFRSFRGVFLPLISVSMSTIWVLGTMSIFNVSLTAISNIIPIILIAIGTAYCIHVINIFDEEIKDNTDKKKKSINALGKIGIPVILTAITTAVGFIAFIFGSYLTLIQEFGLFSSLGVLFSLIISITFVPSVLYLLPVKSRLKSMMKSTEKKTGIIIFMDKFGTWVLNNSKLIVVGGVIIAIIGIIGIPRIERKVDMIDYFKKGSEIRNTEELMVKKFGGSIPIQILVKGDIQDPIILNEMKLMGDFLDSQDNVSNAQSVADLIIEMSDVMGEGRMIPDSKEKVTNLWFLLDGEDVLSQLVNDEKTEAIIQATIANADTKKLKDLVKAVDKFIESLDSSVISFSQSGMPLIYQNLDDSIMNSQFQSMVLAIILVFISLVFLLRSFIGGIIGLLPIGFTLLVLFGFMGYFSIPLDIATVLVGSISIGIGIDYSIHFVSRFKLETKKHKNGLNALQKTLETTGRAILINVITVMMGFLVLVLANMIPLQRFGVLIALTMVGSGIGAITILPAVILVTKANFIGEFSRILNKTKNHLNNIKKEKK